VTVSQHSAVPLAYAHPTARAAATRGGGAVHFLAVLTAFATFPLIFMGGLVTSHQAGMSVPDWPNSYGYNMFLFPPRLWIGGILYEHTHRLMATVVGMLAIALTIAAWLSKRATRRDKWLATALLGAVIFQGVLGGLRVVLIKLGLAIVHACVAQAFFCFAAFVAVYTSEWWKEQQPTSTTSGRGLIWLSAITVAAIYGQLMVGATMRHYQAGLAIPDLPLAYGKVLPPMNQEALDAINWQRVRMEPPLPAVSLEQVWLHFGHRLGAMIVSILVLALAWTVARRYRMHPRLVRPGLLLVVLLAVQLTLGVLTVLLRKPADVASSHVAVGALVLVTSFILTTRAARLFATAPRGQAPGVAESWHGLPARGPI
jgi:cytochrome c oxidase assembly protein subunit 15